MKRRQGKGKGKALPSSSVNASHSQDKSTKEPQTNEWGLLIPELVEMVIERLDFEEDRSSILNMRVVHPHWNQVVNGVLERRQLSALSNWAPFHECWDMEEVYPTKYRPLCIPKLEVAPFSRDSEGIVAEVVAGFPKALYLCPKSEERMTRVKKGKREEASSLALGASVSSTFSPNLTSVVLHAIQYSPKHLQQLLNEAPQLRTLEIIQTTVMLKGCQDFEAKWPLPPLAKLTTLIVRENGPDYQKPLGKYVIPRWLTKTYTSDQLALTHLEVDKARFVDPWKIEKLEQLKISGLASLPVEQLVASTSLVRLSVHEFEKEKVAFKDFMNFIQRFSEKLVHLHLDVDIYYFKDVGLERKRSRPMRRSAGFGIPIPKLTLPELASEDQVVFNQLKTFAFPFHAVETYWTTVEYMLQQCPALEELQLVDGKASSHYYFEKLEAESKRIWELCSNLKAIQLYETREENSFWKSFKKGEVVTNYEPRDAESSSDYSDVD